MAHENPTYGTYRDLPTTNIVLFDCETNDLNSELVWCIHAYDMDEQKLYKFEPTMKEILKVSGCKSEESYREMFYETGWTELNHKTCDFTEDFLEFFKVRENKVWVAHNALGFDAPELNRLILNPAGLSMDKVLDSVVLSRLFRTEAPYSNMIPWFESKGIDTRQGGHSLEAWGKRLKCFKGDFKDFAGGFSLKMSDYCTQDVRTLFMIWKKLCQEQKQYKFSYESIMTEHRAAKMLRQQQENGFTLDKEQCIALRDETQKLLDHYIEELHKIFPPKRKDLRSFTPRVSKTTGKMYGTDANTLASNLHEKNKDGSYTLYEMVEFNPKSPQQIIERFMELGWTPKEFTDKGNPKTGQDVMPKILDEVAKDHPEAMAMLKYTIVYDRNAKAKKWLELSERDGKMHGSVFHIGAWTHRCAHRNDNMANVASVLTKKVKPEDLPKGLNHFDKIQEGLFKGHLFKSENEIILTGLEGAYGWESRNCWTVDDSSKFTMVGCDASGIQLRALGHYLAEFDGGDYGREVVEGDIHTRNQQAAEIHDRPTAKTFIYCYPVDNTEVLTSNGWKKRDEICVETDKVLSYNPETGKSQWGKINQIVNSGINQVVDYQSFTFHFECTRNHRWVGVNRKEKDRVRFYKEDTFTIDEALYDSKIKTSFVYEGGESLLTDRESSILGWILADGDLKWSGKSRNTEMGVRCGITQSKKKYLDEIKELLGEDTIRGSYSNKYNDCEWISVCPKFVRSLWSKLGLGQGVNKHEPNWTKLLLKLSLSNRVAFLDAFYKAEGWTSYHTKNLSQKKGNIHDGLIAVIQSLGYRVFNKRINDGSDCYVIRMGKNTNVTTVSLKEKGTRLTETYCLDTEFGNCVVRQRDFVTLTGNCWLLGGGDPKVGSIVGVTPEEIQRYKKDKPLLKTKRKAFEFQNIVPTDKMLYEACKGMETKEKFLKNLPALREFKEITIKQAAERGWMEGLDGRKIHVPSEHLAMGAYLQGFEAVVMKHAMWLYQQECKSKGLYYKQLAFVHDEVQLQVLKEEAEEVGKTVVWSIEEAGRQLGVLCPLGGEYNVGSSWAKTH